MIIVKKEVKSKKSQFSMEYLLMMGFTFMLLIPTIILFAQQQNNIESDMSASQATQIARKIADKSEEMYYQGEPSRTTLKVFIPNGVENITFDNMTIIVYFKDSDGVIHDIVQEAPVTINGTIGNSNGLHVIEIRSMGDYIFINET